MTSRQRILDFLRAHPGATSGEISRAMRQTPANARHHLSGLERDGLVRSFRRPSRGRGRPEKAYSLGAALEGDSLAELSELLLDIYLEGLSESEHEVALKGLAEQLGNLPHAPQMTALSRRLAAVVDGLATLHYEPRWEARAAGPQIILGHCPFLAIIARHPELCRMDALLIEDGLGATVRQLAKLEPNERGLPVCVFGVLEETTRS
jgi:predicted ArsR family transcriptional regulator